jgi:2,4-dienoyl-CoA reductase-like NADH-dependent reductase (Old Yellow Enzyme family)/thioredoxin reductase
MAEYGPPNAAWQSTHRGGQVALKKIFEPIMIGKVEIPNRVVRTAHGTHLARDAFDEDSIAYHAARAKGGCGLTIIEAASVHSSSENTLFNRDDRVIPGFQALMKAVRPYGMRVFEQLFHGGHHTFGEGRRPPWSASTIPSPAVGAVPIPMGEPEIAEIVECFAQAARRCREGGLDGVEIHAAHGYLVHQFLSPLTNRRSDRYGGSLENRMRFLLEILRAVRKAVGADYVVGVRLSASQAPGSIAETELIEVRNALIAGRLIDFLDVSIGDYYRMDTMVSAMPSPTGYELPSSGQLTAGVDLPRIVSGRVRTLEDAEQILRDGAADLVSLVRAQIADPELVRKTRDGRSDEVRPCIGCNQGCIGGLIRDMRLGCAVNPAVGFERTLAEDLITKSSAPRKLLVVGGGPAGMEAARVGALLGHKVVLAEANSRLGGAVNAAKRSPAYLGVGDIVNWQEREIYRLGVEVRLGTYLEAEGVLAERADAVIVATGSMPRMDGVQFGIPAQPASGVNLPHVVSSIDLLLGPGRDLGRSALVLDDTGHFEALAAAEWLIAKGVAVTFVTRFGTITPYVETTLRTVPALERLYKGDFTLLTRHQLLEIRAGSARVRPTQSERIVEVAADTVVLVTPNEPLRSLYDELRDRQSNIVLVGDALAPRDLQVAIGEGHRATRALL